MSTYIWDIVVRARQGYANEVDFARGDMYAANLELLLGWYGEANLPFLPETTKWMVKEIIEALHDVERDAQKKD